MSIFASYDKVFQPVFYQFTLLKLFRKEKKISGSFPSRLHDFPRKARREKLSFQIAPNTQRSSKFSHWCPYLQVMIKFSNLCFITLPCWNSSGKRKRAPEAFHSPLLDFPRKARIEDTSFQIIVITNSSQYPKGKKIDSPYLQVMIKFSNLRVITLPCWNSSGKRKRALEAFHSWLLDFPRQGEKTRHAPSIFLTGSPPTAAGINRLPPKLESL